MKKIQIMALPVLCMIFLAACGIGGERVVTEEEILEERESVSRMTDAETMEEETLPWREQVYEIGDIVLADGSVVKTGDFKAIDRQNLPMAVIAGFKSDGTVFAVGVHRSDNPLPWTPEDSASYGIGFSDMICTQNGDGTFSGDRDGSDNWDVICVNDREGAADSSKNYPAFDFVNGYGETYDLTETYASGWYMPDIGQLCDLYENREFVNRALKKISGMDDKASMESLGTNWYWSSSQAGSQDDYAWFVHYLNGYGGECPKSFTNLHVIAVRDF